MGAGDESIWHFVYGGSVEGRDTQHIWVWMEGVLGGLCNFTWVDEFDWSMTNMVGITRTCKGIYSNWEIDSNKVNNAYNASSSKKVTSIYM